MFRDTLAPPKTSVNYQPTLRNMPEERETQNLSRRLCSLIKYDYTVMTYYKIIRFFGFEPRRMQDVFTSPRPFTPAVETTQPPLRRVLGLPAGGRAVE
jgi:hypothetical protein